MAPVLFISYVRLALIYSKKQQANKLRGLNAYVHVTIEMLYRKFTYLLYKNNDFIKTTKHGSMDFTVVLKSQYRLSL